MGSLYHATKFAVEGMSEALSFKLRNIGGGVKIIEPGDTLTDFKIYTPESRALAEYQPAL